MRVEFTPYNYEDAEDYFRPMLDLENAGNDGWFNQFKVHYDGLWEKSERYIAVEGSRSAATWRWIAT